MSKIGNNENTAIFSGKDIMGFLIEEARAHGRNQEWASNELRKKDKKFKKLKKLKKAQIDDLLGRLHCLYDQYVDSETALAGCKVELDRADAKIEQLVDIEVHRDDLLLGMQGLIENRNDIGALLRKSRSEVEALTLNRNHIGSLLRAARAYIEEMGGSTAFQDSLDEIEFLGEQIDELNEQIDDLNNENDDLNNELDSTSIPIRGSRKNPRNPKDHRIGALMAELKKAHETIAEKELKIEELEDENDFLEEITSNTSEKLPGSKRSTPKQPKARTGRKPRRSHRRPHG